MTEKDDPVSALFAVAAVVDEYKSVVLQAVPARSERLTIHICSKVLSDLNTMPVVLPFGETGLSHLPVNFSMPMRVVMIASAQITTGLIIKYFLQPGQKGRVRQWYNCTTLL
jgi:hypothetical protein